MKFGGEWTFILRRERMTYGSRTERNGADEVLDRSDRENVRERGAGEELEALFRQTRLRRVPT